MGETPLVPQLPLVATGAVVAVGLAGAAAAGVAGAPAPGAAETLVGGRGAASGPGHLHFHRLQGAVDVDVLGLGWGIFGGTFTSLRAFLWGRHESMRPGRLSEELRAGNGAGRPGFLGLCWWHRGTVSPTSLAAILTFLINPTDHLV